MSANHSMKPERTARDGSGAAESTPSRRQPPDKPRPPAGYPRSGVIVDDRLAVMEFLGNTGRYLQLPVGKARFHLPLMLGPGLEHPIMVAVRQVRGGLGVVRKERLPVTSESGIQRINVEVTRLDCHPSGKPAIRVLFEEAACTVGDSTAADVGASKAPSGLAGQKQKEIGVTRLKEELRVTRATLESIIEEQEIGTARLKSAYYQLETVNTELEATNEELAAANVELETLNEALQETIRERDAAERERQALEAEVIQAQRLESLRVMAGGVAHDFNNLLTSIVGNANVLLEELTPESELWEAAEQIEKAGQHAAALVRQMLAFCGRGTLSTELLDLSSLVWESVDLLRASISKTAELRCELANDLPAIQADPTQVRQVLINLVVNASEAIGSVAGVIRVSTRRLDVPEGQSYRTALEAPLGPGSYVCLEVADTGRGMSEETKAKLFEPFFSTKFAGRGLGLAAVLGIVRGHRGSIQVYSRQAQGTEIEILFPAAQACSQPPRGTPAAADWRADGTVLVVDDEEPIRNIAKAVLKRAGLQVVTAQNGPEALQILRRGGTHGISVSAVLLDLVMPGMDGNEVLAELRSFDPDLPVILSSGYAQGGASLERLAACGPTSFLAKPYRPAELIEKLREVWAAPGARQGERWLEDRR
jgi:signal transduction histidine kinase/ActR/RegA family two-component response regulator